MILPLVRALPNPVRLELADPDARRLDCRSLVRCLTTAVTWAGYSCADCRAYVAIDELERRSDLEAMANLWYAVGRVRRLEDARELALVKVGAVEDGAA